MRPPLRHHPLRTLALCLALLVSRPGAISAGPGDEPLANDHWAYEAIYELYAGGVWGEWPVGARPWYRGDIAARIRRLTAEGPASGRLLGPGQARVLDRLRSEFRDELEADVAGDDLRFRVGGSPGVSGALERWEDPLLRSRFAAFLGVGRGPWWVRLRGDIDSHGDLDPTFFGRDWKGNLTGTIDLAFFSYRRRGLEVLVGRDFVRWGSGSHDVLLLGDQSPPFDLARFGYHHRWFDFHYFVTGLDGDFAVPEDDPAYVGLDVKRYLAGHRLELRPWRTLVVGFSEVVVWGGPERQLEAYYLNPFLPFYWEQLNAGKDDNPLWSLDVSYLVPAGPMLYGEWLIDDFQIDFSSEPHQIGGQVGLNWAAPAGLAGGFLTLEWARIQPSVYGQNRPYNRYLNHRVGIGSTLGPDADRWFARWRQHLSPRVDGTILFVRERHGEREIDTPQEAGLPYGEPFPTGVVEKEARAEAQFLYQPHARFRLEAAAGYRWRRNADHREGEDRDGGFARLSLVLVHWLSGAL